MADPIIKQLRAAIDAKHGAALRALETLADYLEESCDTNGGLSSKKKPPGRKPPSRAGTGKIRNAVLPAFSRDFRSVGAVAQETGFKVPQVRGVVTVPALKGKFSKKEIGGVIHYKYEGDSTE